MLKIFQIPNCVYCQRVFREIENLNLVKNKDYEWIEAKAGSTNRDFVIEEGGKNQVPFLIDGNFKTYESDIICVYLKKKFGK